MGRDIDEILANKQKNIRNRGKSSLISKISFWRKEV